MGIKLVIDTTADMTTEDLDESVAILPIPIYFGQEEFIPYVNLTLEEFYKKQKESTSMPHTSQVSYKLLYDTFKTALDNGDDVIGIFLASKMSGTFNSARLAKEELKSDRIFLIDAETVTFPYGALVYQAFQYIKQGLKTEDIVAKMEYLVPRIKMLAVIDDLTYLKMGGRISGPVAVLANFLHFKPIIDISEGVIHNVAKERGLKKAYLKMTEIINSADVDLSLPVFMGHTNDLEKCDTFTNIIEENTKLRPIKKVFIGPSVGTHAGPGSTGVCYFIK